MMTEQEEIKKALKTYDLWIAKGFAAVSHDELEEIIVIIVNAYRGQKPAPAEQGEATMDAKRCAVLAWRSNDRTGGMDWIDMAAIVIEDFAKRYAERKGEKMRAEMEDRAEKICGLVGYLEMWQAKKDRPLELTRLIDEANEWLAALATPAEVKRV
jgi:hypothetical protein